MKSLLQSEKTKQILKIFLAVVVLMVTIFTLTACGDKKEEGTDKAEVVVSERIANIGGITVVLGENTTVDGKDLASRNELYGNLGELKQINITVSGTVSRAECDEKAIPMNAGEIVEDDASPIGYYTDFFEMKILVPEGATKYGYIDGNPQKLDQEIGLVDENGYFSESVQWLLGAADKSSWNTCGKADTQDGYFYYKFLNDSDEIVDQFFVRVVYDVTFVD